MRLAAHLGRAALAAIALATAGAATAAPLTLRCQGSYYDFTQQGRNAQHDDIQVVVSERISISGIAAFAAVYEDAGGSGNRTFFELASIKGRRGIITITGKDTARLTVFNEDGKGPDGEMRYRQLLAATCVFL